MKMQLGGIACVTLYKQIVQCDDACGIVHSTHIHNWKTRGCINELQSTCACIILQTVITEISDVAQIVSVAYFGCEVG